jgi:predicted phosphodiesterase
MNFTKKHLLSLGLVSTISLLSTAAFATGVLPGTLLKSPYLIYPGVNTQMEVLWQDSASQTDTLSWYSDAGLTQLVGSADVASSGVVGPATLPADSTVTLATLQTAYQNQQNNQVANNQHIYTITGLTADTKYYFKVSNGATTYATGSFITAPADSATHVKFLGMGDSRSQPFAANNVMQEMRHAYAGSTALDPEYQRFCIHNGDWVASDGDSNWTSEWFDPTKTDMVTFLANTPINGVKGNHDNASGYGVYFAKYYPYPYHSLATKTASTTSYNNLYYSYDYGPVHFINVDEYTTFTPGSAQWNWIVSDLASTTKPWKILVYHEGAYTAGSDADNVSARQLETLLTTYNVDLVYNGHSHNYARAGAYTAAQAGNDLIALNVPHITSGAGGAPLYTPDLTNNGNYPHVITASSNYEYMTFDVNGKTLTMTAHKVNNVSSSAITPTTRSEIETIVLNHFTNVSPQISATTGNFVYNRATKLYTGNLTITNNGPALSGNIDVVLDGILNLQGIGNAIANPASIIATKPATGKGSSDPGLLATVTLTNATGQNNGEPMIQATTSGLDAGASITVPLTFSNPTNAKINFTPVTYQE